MDSAGLLLFTNDGKLAHRLSHPRFGVEKEYRVLARGPLSDEGRRRLELGVALEEGTTSPARVSIPRLTARGFSLFRITLHEGWNRQVRRMCAAIGLEVLRLTRISYGFLAIDGLPPGALRRLSPDEEKRLRALTAGDPPLPAGRMAKRPRQA
jgi:23S rRNA pseudouridine2605 synthase